MSWNCIIMKTSRFQRSRHTARSPAIKRAEGILLGLEERLGLAKRFRRIQEGLDLIIRDARDIRNYNDRFGTFREITDKTNEIIEIASTIND